MTTEAKLYQRDFNTEVSHKGSKLIITVDLAKPSKTSESGKSNVVGSAQGRMKVNGSIVGYSLNAFTSLTESEKAAVKKAEFDAAVQAEIERRKQAA